MARSIDRQVPVAVATMIDEAARLLVEAAHPDKIILFGSYARGDHSKGSDLDFLVIVPSLESRFEEMVRLRMALRDIPMAMDIVVYSRDQIEERGHLRGTMLYHALRDGKVLYDAT